MSRIRIFFLFFLLFAGCGMREGEERGKPIVATSFYPMYDFAKKIGGEEMEIFCLIPDGMEVHDWEPTPRDMARLQKADALIYNGAGMEHWIPAVLETLRGKDISILETSQGISLCEGGCCAEHHHGHPHHHDHANHHDPHVWLAPQNARHQMAQICALFVTLDPENRAVYESRLEKYSRECDVLDTEFREMVESMPNRNILVTHAAFAYLCKAYGLTQVALEGSFASSDPEPAKMAEMIRFAREHQIGVIYRESTTASKVADALAKEIGGRVAVLDPLEKLSQERQAAGEDYFSVMRQNLQALQNLQVLQGK
ncbi:MAG: zinc ABC transporter substrate-binding protein [Planctomycetia bacterium]|nr:zinc ABC transporter substrate-binding protein [Planctomycetia bacterium]